MTDNIYSVSEFIVALNVSLRQHRATVEGEITGRINRRGGVTYFSLHDRDQEAALQCMAFNRALDDAGVALEEGMAVQAAGFPEIWQRSGNFSFKVFEIILIGEGALARQFEALKKKLESEGFFAPERKKPIPRFARAIGLITAEGREAQTDFLTHLIPRGISVDLVDARVEGPQAISQIVEAIEYFNRYNREVEVLVLTRGGGDLQSLQAFNSEAVARAIFASKIPVICGVGHEKDVTIADLVADVRASTPTHAGRIVSEDWIQAESELAGRSTELLHGIQTMLGNAQHTLSSLSAHLDSSIEWIFERSRARLKEFASKLRLADPSLRLKQGYSIAYGARGAIKSVDQLTVGDMIQIQFYDGNAKTEIRSKERKK